MEQSRTVTIQNCMHTFHQRWLNIMESNRLVRTVIKAVLDVNTVFCIPV